MENTGLFGVIIMVITAMSSYYGFRNESFLNKYIFSVDRILAGKDYKRLITSGFLHGSWLHLIFNMVALSSFSRPIERYLGEVNFLIIYFTSLLAGNLLSLFLHKNHYNYRALGASGAVSGVMFSCLALFPEIQLGIIGIPLKIPGVIMGLAFIFISIFGIKNQSGNIGHDAHLGGAITGMVISILMVPAALKENYLTISVILIPSLIFIYLIATKPKVLLIGNSHKPGKYDTKDNIFNHYKKEKENEINRLLDKINRKGFESLSEKEKNRLEELSR